ncbi:MAG TPA: SDR family NAD(P)-dependent oxidoreductase [Candidatus Angelobacter sp.]|nr:SDR family NAD(P)-dependent oxidoreductase [Candidatus Angelobacter sp.]
MQNSPMFDGSEIAIIGMSCNFPGADSPRKYWENLRQGIDSISFLSAEELEPSGVDPAALSDPCYVKAGAFLDKIEFFDASFFGITATEARMMDPQHRVFLQCCWSALEDAGYNPENYEGAIGLFAGARTSSYLFNLYSNPEVAGAMGAFEIGLGNDMAFLTSRVSYKLNLRGPCYSVHTACSTSLVAVHLACQSLLIDECQMALAGGVAINVPQKTGYLYKRGGILSPDGRCRAFDEKSEGTVFGSGVGLLVLKRLEDALQDGDSIHAIIRGSATNNDGSAKASFTAPSIQGQTRVILDALATAGVQPETISYIEAHGTGTPIGDPIEMKALSKAFRGSTGKERFCGIGSVKTNLGHLDAAAGIASIIKTILSLRHHQLVPTVHFTKPNPQIDFSRSPFFVVDCLMEWKRGESPRRAGVSAFGVGGTNAHVVLEEAPPLSRTSGSRPWQLLLLSSKSASALENLSRNLAEHLRQTEDACLADAAFTLAVGRAAFPHCKAVVCRNDKADAIAALEDQARVRTTFQNQACSPLVFMFPGQGSQYAGMGQDLYAQERIFREEMDRCADHLKNALNGTDIRRILYPKEAEKERVEQELNQTWLTQCVLFTVEYALARQWMAWGLRPQAMIGHSLGEYVAACLAGVFSLETALDLVVLRGRMMQQTFEGAMLAVGLKEEEASALTTHELSLAAINATSQCVLSGTVAAVEEVEAKLKAGKIPCYRLETSRAFHSTLMETVLAQFSAYLAQVDFQPPHMKYISNVTGEWIREEEATSPEYWVRHLRLPVRFHQGLATIIDEHPPILLEVGPGNSLGKLAQSSFSPGLPVLSSLPSARSDEPHHFHLLRSLGDLWLHRAAIDWKSYYQDEVRRRISLPTYPFDLQRYWIEPRPQAFQEGTAPAGNKAGAAPVKNTNISDWFYARSWKLSARKMPRQTSGPQSWLVFSDHAGFGPMLATRLREAGHSVITVQLGEKFSKLDEHTYSIRPEEKESYQLLFSDLQAAAPVPEKIVHCFSIGSAPETETDDFEYWQKHGYYSLLYLAQSVPVTGEAGKYKITVLTSEYRDITGECRVNSAKAPLSAPCLVISQENPSLEFRCVDVSCRGGRGYADLQLVRRVEQEAMSASTEKVVCLRGNSRWVESYEEIPLDQESQNMRKLRPGGIYLITGGLGSVGLLVAEYLAKETRAKLILTARNPLPPRNEWQAHIDRNGVEDVLSSKILAVRKLEELGAEVLVFGADASHENQMNAAIDAAYRRFGGLNGVIHAAGITSGTSLYKSYKELGRTESEEQFRPKAGGARVLRKILAERDIDFCVLFSSNAAVLGGLGYLTYAAANAFMDSFATEMAREDGRWISASWDPWPRETKKFEYRTSVDQYAMTPEEALEAFHRIVTRAPAGHMIVATGSLRDRLRVWAEISPGDASHPQHTRPELSTQYVPPGNETEKRIIKIWEAILGVARIGIVDNFFDLGGHSLLAIKLMNQVCEEFQVDLSISKLFESPTVSGLSRLVSQADEDPQKERVLKVLAEL